MPGRSCRASSAIFRRTRQADRTGDARRRHRARPPGARPDQGSSCAHGAQLRRSWPAEPPPSASRPARSMSRARHPSSVPITRAAWHHHRASPTMAAGSTPSAIRAPRQLRERTTGARRPSWKKHDRRPTYKFICLPRLLDRGAGDLGVRPRASAMDVVRTNARLSGVAGLHSTSPAVVGREVPVSPSRSCCISLDRLDADRAAGKATVLPSPLDCSADRAESTGPRFNSWKHPHRADQGHRAASRLRNKLRPADPSAWCLLTRSTTARRQPIPRNGFIVGATQVGARPSASWSSTACSTREIVDEADVDASVLGTSMAWCLRQHRRPGRWRRRDRDPHPTSNGKRRALGASGLPRLTLEPTADAASAMPTSGEQLTSLLVFAAPAP